MTSNPTVRRSWELLFFFFGTALLIGAGLSSILHYLYPVAAVALAAYLYWRNPTQYISLVWWLWFLSPFIRRVVDYKSSYMDPSPILLAAPVSTLICFPTFFTRMRDASPSDKLPFLLALASATYGFCIGVVQLPPKTLIVAALGWFPPIVFGFFVYSLLGDPRYKELAVSTILKTFKIGILIVGLYGLYQLVQPPIWDQQWMIVNSDNLTSIGSPEPFAIRVFSTMNVPGLVAIALEVGLLLMITENGLITWLAIIAAFGSLTFSMIRAAWFSLVVGLVLIAVRGRQLAGKLISITSILCLCLVFAQFVPELHDLVQTRLETFQDLKGDASYQDRQSGYVQYAQFVQSEPFGLGLGGILVMAERSNSRLGAYDSGIVEIFVSLGWFGGLTYLLALALLTLACLKRIPPNQPFIIAASAIAVSLVAQLPFGGMMRDFPGVALWSFAGACMSLRKSPVARAAVARKSEFALTT